VSTHHIPAPIFSITPLARLRRAALGLVVVFIAACGGSGDAPPPFEIGTPVAPPAAVAPAITQQPANVSVAVGANASFSVAASGTAPLSYQWQRNGVAIEAATGPSYTLAAATLADSGATFRAVVSNGVGSATSDAGTLTVTSTPAQPASSQSGPCYGTGPRGGWCMQNRDPVSADLLGGSAPTATTAYAVGGGSIVIKTTDGGTTWQRLRQFDIDTGFCRGLAAPDVNTVYAGCQQGDIIKSTDGGLTWTKQKIAVNAIMQDVAAHSANVVWALGLGFGVSRTTDGTTWTKLSTISGNIQHLASPDDNSAFVAVDFYNVARTTDGGATWTTTTIGTAADDGEIVAITAPSAAVAWTVSVSGTVKRTTDGSTWTAVTRPRSGTYSANQASAIYATDANNAYISYAGADSSGFPTAQIYRTSDGGATWTATRVDSLGRLGMTRLFSGDAGRVWGIGYGGTIFATTDQGTTWTEQSKGPNLPLVNISVVDSNVAWAGGFGPTVSRTTDGTHWSYVYDQENNGAFATSDRLTVAGVSASTAFAAGSVGVMIKTVDGGATWTVVTDLGPNAVASTPNAPRTISRADDGTIWTAGDTFIGRSTDSGTTWTTALPPTGSNYLGKIVGINAQIAYAQFGQGGWYRTTDGGTTFQAVPSLSAYLGLVSLDASTYVAVGLHGTIARSTDGGATFTTVSQTVAPTGEDLQAVARGSSNVVWAGSSKGVLRSDDAGLTWRLQRAPTLELGLVQAMAGIDANTAWAVGYTSGIIKTTDGGD
jgi:photosystem II stability/assembly factor-like uncharacterized protein